MDNRQGSTSINVDIMEENVVSVTAINAEMIADSNQTQAVQNVTAINNELSSVGGLLSEGYVLNDKYIIKRRLDKNSGEADLYIGEFENTEYVIKVYRRNNAIKEEVIQKLLEANCPNLPTLYDVGFVNQRQYEVMDYYKGGSLEGEVLSLEELKSALIPDMNEALHALDLMNIVHKDIKPSNIMRKGDGRYVLMDFGISSVRTNKQSLVVTKTGFTPEYIAPEALANLYSVYSDYYALGISIYQLYFGHLPYEGMNQEEMSQFNLVQALPIPEDTPIVFKTLIRGLTFKDLTGRHEAGNINIRWTYEQVKDWLSGKDMIEPTNTFNAQAQVDSQMEAYDFCQEVYNDVDSLIFALANNWKEGKKHLFRGYLQEYFRTNKMRSIASLCGDAEALGSDEAYAAFLYNATNRLDKIYWKDSSWYPEELGSYIMKTLWGCMDVYDKSAIRRFKDILEILDSNVVYNFYIARHKGKNAEVSDLQKAKKVEKITSIIKIYQEYGVYKFFQAMYQLGYLLTEQPVLYIKGKYYKTYMEFMGEIERIILNNEEETEYIEFMNKIWTDQTENKIELQVGCWLSELGHSLEGEES